MNTVRSISKYLLAVFMIFAGAMHFIKPQFYVSLMPDYLPWHLPLVYLSGLAEAACGVLLLVPRYARLAAWGIVGVLIAVFPANIHIYQHQDLIPASSTLHLLRLPLQAVFLAWAYWHTRPAGAQQPAPHS